jgi:hypothetical protein
MKKHGRCIAFYAFDGIGNLKAVPCKRWSCQICQKLNAQLWAWRAELQIENDPLQWYLLTFTMGSDYKDVTKAYADLKKLWDKCRTYFKRDYIKRYGYSAFSWTYMAFVEGQPRRNYMPHFHVLSPLPAPYRIKDFAVQVGFGYMADEREINGKGASQYVAKYASKGAGGIPKNFRRVRASQDWAKLPDYNGGILFVKGATEHVTDYIIRVHEYTGVPLDSLYDKWIDKGEV